MNSLEIDLSYCIFKCRVGFNSDRNPDEMKKEAELSRDSLKLRIN